MYIKNVWTLVTNFGRENIDGNGSNEIRKRERINLKEKEREREMQRVTYRRLEKGEDTEMDGVKDWDRKRKTKRGRDKKMREKQIYGIKERDRQIDTDREQSGNKRKRQRDIDRKTLAIWKGKKETDREIQTEKRRYMNRAKPHISHIILLSGVYGETVLSLFSPPAPSLCNHVNSRLTTKTSAVVCLTIDVIRNMVLTLISIYLKGY